MSAEFKPGDRVLVEAVVESVTKDGGAYLLPGASRNLFYLDQDNLHPLPTPAQKLRDAAEVLGVGSRLGTLLKIEADHHEAAAAPQPTLSDLIDQLAATDGSSENVASTDILAARVRAVARQMRAALSREEASHA